METKKFIPTDFCDYNHNKLDAETHLIEYTYIERVYEDDDDDESELIGYRQKVEIFVNGEHYESEYIQSEDDFCRYRFHDEYIKLCKQAKVTPISLGF